MSDRFTAETVVAPHGAIRSMLLAGSSLDVLTIDERTGAQRRLSGASAAVWSYLDRPTTVIDLVRGVQETFGLTHELAASAVAQALEQLWAEGMLAGTGEEPQPAHARRVHATGLEVLPREPDP